MFNTKKLKLFERLTPFMNFQHHYRIRKLKVLKIPSVCPSFEQFYKTILKILYKIKLR